MAWDEYLPGTLSLFWNILGFAICSEYLTPPMSYLEIIFPGWGTTNHYQIRPWALGNEFYCFGNSMSQYLYIVPELVLLRWHPARRKRVKALTGYLVQGTGGEMSSRRTRIVSWVNLN